jgi:hypothetical protein
MYCDVPCLIRRIVELDDVAALERLACSHNNSTHEQQFRVAKRCHELQRFDESKTSTSASTSAVSVHPKAPAHMMGAARSSGGRCGNRQTTSVDKRTAVQLQLISSKL